MLRYVLLALMADGRPVHGYALMKAFAERSATRVSIGNVYRELQRLAADGMIAAAANPDGADPRRAPWAITERGRVRLAAWRATAAHRFVRAAPDALVYRLALLADEDPARACAFLDELHAELAVQARALERERERRDDGRPTRAVLLGRRARHLAADLAVLEELRVLVGPEAAATPSR